MDESKEVYRVTFSFYILDDSKEGWVDRIKQYGGGAIAFSLISLISCMIGLVGLQRKNPSFVNIFYIGVCLYIGSCVGHILGFAWMSEDFTISTGVAWTLTFVLMIATFALVYFPICVYSLYLKLRKEQKGEIKQVPKKKRFISYWGSKTKVDPGFKCLRVYFKVGESETEEA